MNGDTKLKQFSMDDDITLNPHVTIAKQVEAMIQQLRSVS
jgi:hypothetical protein